MSRIQASNLFALCFACVGIACSPSADDGGRSTQGDGTKDARTHAPCGSCLAKLDGVSALSNGDPKVDTASDGTPLGYRSCVEGTTSHQCTELANAYLQSHFGKGYFVHGNAIAWCNAANLVGDMKIESVGDGKPAVHGDLVVWTTHGGHVGVYAGGGKLVEQNASASGVRSLSIDGAGWPSDDAWFGAASCLVHVSSNAASRDEVGDLQTCGGAPVGGTSSPSAPTGGSCDCALGASHGWNNFCFYGAGQCGTPSGGCQTDDEWKDGWARFQSTCGSSSSPPSPSPTSTSTSSPTSSPSTPPPPPCSNGCFLTGANDATDASSSICGVAGKCYPGVEETTDGNPLPSCWCCNAGPTTVVAAGWHQYVARGSMSAATCRALVP